MKFKDFIMQNSRLRYNWDELSRVDKTSIITSCVMKNILLRGNNQRIGLKEINVNIGKNKPNMRIDVLEINKKKNVLVGYEIKSCIQDFRTDKKWEKYLSLVNQLYFVFDSETYKKYEEEILDKIQYKAGIYVYCDNLNFLLLKQGVKFTELPPKEESFYRIILYNYLFRKAKQELKL